MVEKKKKIINTCLETFADNGLIEISMRDLGAALDMEAANIYYYFKNRDELVLACAEEAKERIENKLFGVAIQDIDNPELLVKELAEYAVEMRPLMGFFISVCVSQRYNDAMQPILRRLSDRYKRYISIIAEKLCCNPEEIAPHVYTVINTLLSYMIFGQSSFTAPQLALSYEILQNILINRDQQKFG